ncbi:MAG: response regulator [Bacteroidetes bacterium]|nr:response regulator [Bacteroidota bacterium]MBU1678460.1 response regulator [Bacteroidota bacterium]MBU2505235.1 response regulator [Bacteroidota bacterium]
MSKENQFQISKSTAHDINNLLMSINNSLELIEINIKNPSKILVLKRNMATLTQRIAEIIEDSLSSVPGQKFRKVNLIPLLEELYFTLENSRGKRVKIEKEYSAEAIYVPGNATQLSRVLMNIGVNALEAIEDIGSIKISAYDSVTEKMISSDQRLKNFKDYSVIRIKDSGAGISEEYIKNIFIEGFSTKTKERISGIGLHSAKKIIEEHSGEIFIASTLKKGATFTILLPRYANNFSGNLKMNEKKKILLADDEETILELLRDLLESYGYEVVTAKNGKELLEKYNYGIDLCIIDQKMPVMDGFTAIAKLRKSNITIPVLLTSGSQSLKDEKRIKKLQINSILTKPYDFEELVRTIAQIIR